MTERKLSGRRARGGDPAALSGAQGGCAVHAVKVADASMAPRFEPGELAYAVPRQMVRAGDDILLVLTDGRRLIRRLVRQNAGVLHCRQFSPARACDIPVAQVKAVAPIVGRAFCGGPALSTAGTAPR